MSGRVSGHHNFGVQLHEHNLPGCYTDVEDDLDPKASPHMSISYRFLAAGATLALVITAFGTYTWWISRPGGPALDPLMHSAFSRAEDVKTYLQYVDTTIAFPDRTLVITGRYLSNEPAMTYDAISTTTLGIPGVDERPSFRLHTISIGTDVYVTIASESPLLRGSIPVTDWKHFKADTIPPELTGIAISGPVLDNLQLLKGHGRYLRLAESVGARSWGTSTLSVYRFTLSGSRPSETGTVTALMDRIATGTVDLWVDPATADVRHMVFSNDPYYSTTTLSAMNAVPEVVPPIPER